MAKYLKHTPTTFHGTYGVNYYFKDANGAENRLQFETDVRYCGQHMKKYAIYHLTKRAFVVNRNETDEYLYDIAKKCASAVYPLAVLLDKDKKVVYMKPPKVKERWLKVRAELEQYYKGETAVEYINKFENKLNSNEFFNRILESDLFWMQLFAIDYGVDKIHHNQYKLPFFPYMYPIGVDSEQSIDEEGLSDIDSKYFRVFHHGESTGKFRYGDIYNEIAMEADRFNSEVSARLDVAYEIDNNNGRIESIEADYAIYVDDEIHSSIRMEGYRLHEKPLDYDEDNEFKLMEKESKRKK